LLFYIAAAKLLQKSDADKKKALNNLLEWKKLTNFAGSL